MHRDQVRASLVEEFGDKVEERRNQIVVRRWDGRKGSSLVYDFKDDILTCITTSGLDL